VKHLKLKAESMLPKAKASAKALTVEKLQAMSQEELELRIKLLEENKAAFTQIHDSLEWLYFNEIGSQLRYDFEELIISIQIMLSRELGKRQRPAIRSSTLRPEPSLVFYSVSAKRFHLPELRLPEFPFQSHIMEILGLPKLDMQSATKLKDMSDKIDANLRALQSMGSVEQISNCILVHL